MHIILTHEQADFDAIASLLAARLLEPNAYAVLPRRINRNVRAYLTLYGHELPLMEYSDLPRRRVERMTIVDTQSPTSVKGVGPHTAVHVIDHHPTAPNLEPAWTKHIEEIGATTTILIDEVQKSNVELDLISATLLLLGIYEDTGSLSYPNTTSRDVRASAWLLDCGASLTMAFDFLNHPLSAEQRRLFDQLLEAAEIHEMHGLSVVVACGKADGMVDEISTLAHKLRDLFDPDGLIVLVELDGSVQMVGRSATEALDIGQVAEHFGGGGHRQAAAALIRDRDIDEICEDLIAYLQKVIRPARTVGEIMSRGPQLLAPTDRIKDAEEQMQHFGHEGYPVVDGGKVIGLLTRRAVDRAMMHGMGDRPVTTIMEVGNLVVYPDNPVQHLQRMMIQYDWGQVPVADRGSGKIIGIVTRTDLLKTLGAAISEPAVASLADKLEGALPPERLKMLKLVARRAMAHGAALYIVGGFVRDLLLDEPSVDFDLVVEGDAISLACDLADSFGGRVSSHRRFGTAKWRLDRSHLALCGELGKSTIQEGELPASLDFVSARTEFYAHPTALPSVEQGSIKLDLHRRDFTINTLALRLDGRYYGQLLDHWGGGRDLQEGLIRVLHSISFVDDPTRMLRAVRLEQRLGFKIEQRTLELLEQALPLLDRVSGDRIRHELDQIFNEAQPVDILARLHELQLLEAIHPSLTWDGWLEERVQAAKTFSPPSVYNLAEMPNVDLLYYALMIFRLSRHQALEVCDRLHFSAMVRDEILEASRVGSALTDMPEGTKPSEYVSFLEGIRENALVAAWFALPEKTAAREALYSFLAEWRYVSPKADGSTLRSLTLPPGPEYSRILWKLCAAWLDGIIQTPEEEKALLARLVEESKAED
jgi:tRNA nucleotidyltransferase (CCA-adding enzyme)